MIANIFPKGNKPAKNSDLLSAMPLKSVPVTTTMGVGSPHKEDNLYT